MVWFVVLLFLFTEFILGAGVFFAAFRLLGSRAKLSRCYGTYLILLGMSFALLLLIRIFDLALTDKLVLGLGYLVFIVWLTGRLLSVSVWRSLGAILSHSALMFGYALLIKAFVVEAFVLPSNSMAPTLLAGDRIIAVKFTPRFCPVQRGDVIILKWTAKPGQVPGPLEQNHVKRLVGLPGDTVELREEDVYINGQLVGKDMPHIFSEYEPFLGIIPPGKMYVIGDNLEASLDSRMYGLLDLSAIIGKATIIYASRVPAERLRPPPPSLKNQPPPEAPGRIRWERICKVVR